MSEGVIIAVVGVVGAILAALITRSGSRVEGRLERLERDVEAFGGRLERIGDRFDRLAADVGTRIDRLFEAVSRLGSDEGVQARYEEAPHPTQEELAESLTQAMTTALADFKAAWTKELQGTRRGKAVRAGRPAQKEAERANLLARNEAERAIRLAQEEAKRARRLAQEAQRSSRVPAEERPLRPEDIVDVTFEEEDDSGSPSPSAPPAAGSTSERPRRGERPPS